jgi:hypothetical protein
MADRHDLCDERGDAALYVGQARTAKIGVKNCQFRETKQYVYDGPG